jgi:hypothetical protein
VDSAHRRPMEKAVPGPRVRTIKRVVERKIERPMQKLT